MCNALENNGWDNQMKVISSDKSISHVQRRGLTMTNFRKGQET